MRALTHTHTESFLKDVSFQLNNIRFQPSAVGHAFVSSTWNAEAGGSFVVEANPVYKVRFNITLIFFKTSLFDKELGPIFHFVFL